MPATENMSEELDQSTVLHSVLRQHQHSRRNTYTRRVPLVLQKKLLILGDEQSTIADSNDEHSVSDTLA